MSHLLHLGVWFKPFAIKLDLRGRCGDKGRGRGKRRGGDSAERGKEEEGERRDGEGESREERSEGREGRSGSEGDGMGNFAPRSFLKVGAYAHTQTHTIAYDKTNCYKLLLLKLEAVSN